MSDPATPKRQRRSRLHRWVPYILAAILAGALFAGLRPRATPVETARVTRGLLRETINEEGHTRIRERFVISAPVAGNLRRPQLEAGDKVKAGHTVVAIIDPIVPEPLDARSRALAEARRDSAAALLEKARTAHEFALSDLRRREDLFAQGSISREELENFQLQELAARKELAAAESAWREANAQLAEFTGTLTNHASQSAVEVLAPTSGRILRVLEENARVVAAGTPLMEIGDPTDLEVVIEVLSRDGARLQPGAPVELHHWGDDEPLHAEVRLVEPAAFTKVSALGVEEKRVNVIADLLTPPEKRQGLGDQFRVEARIVVWQATNVLKAPLGAFFRSGTNWAVFAVENGRARMRTVHAGRTGAADMQILDGLQEGEEVVLYPGDRVKDDIRVRPVVISPPASP